MTANTQATTRRQTEIGYETSTFAFGTGIAATALIGIWATACMVGVLVSNGLGGTLKGLFTAITGS